MIGLAPEVLVTAVAPGVMAGTPTAEKLTPEQAEALRHRAALGRATRTEDVADQIVALTRSDSTTGQSIVVDSGLAFR